MRSDRSLGAFWLDVERRYVIRCDQCGNEGSVDAPDATEAADKFYDCGWRRDSVGLRQLCPIHSGAPDDVEDIDDTDICDTCGERHVGLCADVVPWKGLRC
jgi:hypothetical protein